MLCTEMKLSPGPIHSERDKPAWRVAMHGLPVAAKLALLEKAIHHAVALERVKSEWRKSVKSSSSLLPTAR